MIFSLSREKRLHVLSNEKMKVRIPLLEIKWIIFVQSLLHEQDIESLPLTSEIEK